MEEGEKDHVEFVEAGEDTTKPFQPAEQSLDFVASAVHGLVLLPRLQAVRSGRNYGDKTKVQSQLQGLIVLIGSIPDQVQWCWQGPNAAQQFAAFDGVGGLPGGEGKGYGRSSICGNQMNLGGPSAARFADGLRSIFFNAPAPSGWTLTVVESRLTASMRMRTICSRCNCSKT